LKCDGIRAETRFRLSAKRTSPFKSAGASVQATTDSRGVRISGSNAGYTIFRGSVKSTGSPLHAQVSPPVLHRVSSRFNWSLEHGISFGSLLMGLITNIYILLISLILQRCAKISYTILCCEFNILIVFDPISIYVCMLLLDVMYRKNTKVKL